MQNNKYFRIIQEYFKNADIARNNANFIRSISNLEGIVIGEVMKDYFFDVIAYDLPIKTIHNEGWAYMHQTFKISPYSYSYDNNIVVKIDDNVKEVTFEEFYNMLDVKEQKFDEVAFYKDLSDKNIYVFDIGGWTKVKRIVKKKNDKKILEIKLKTGHKIKVTEDHPMIISINKNHTIPANQIKPYKHSQKVIYVVDDKIHSTWIDVVKVEKVDEKVEYVYDLTTESETFVCENIWVHNCIGLSAKDVAAFGLQSNAKNERRAKPPKRLETLFMQCANLICLISQEVSGATSLNDLSTVAAGYLYYLENELNFKYDHYQLVNIWQEFLFNVNLPFRTGNHCVTEDTEVLTPNGWKKWHELKKGDDIYTWKDGKLNIQKVKKVNVYDYDGEMHVYEGKDIIQIVTPNHRVLKRKFDSDEFELVESEKIIDLKTPIDIPVAVFDNDTSEYPISDDFLIMLVFVLTRGQIKSIKEDIWEIKIKVDKNCEDKLKVILNELHISYVKDEKESMYKLKNEDAYKVAKLLDFTTEKLPDFFFKLSKRQADIVIKHWPKEKQKLLCNSFQIASQLQHICFLAGKGSKIIKEKESIYLTFYNEKVKTADKKYKIYYKGKVWCPTTDDGIVVFRKDGKIFISGNSPFSNITLEFGKPNPHLKNEYVIFAGKAINKKYGEIPSSYYDRIVDAFVDAMAEGDADGKPFTFPLITVNIYDNFDWNNKIFRKLLEKSEYFGGLYFQNYMSKPFTSDNIYKQKNKFIEPFDIGMIYSNCCYHPTQEMFVYKNDKILDKLTIEEFFNKYKGDLIRKDNDEKQAEWYKLNEKVYVPALNMDTGKIEKKRVSKLLKIKSDKLITVVLKNGAVLKCEPTHPFIVFDFETGKLKRKFAKDLTTSDYVAVINKNIQEGEITYIKGNIKGKEIKIKVNEDIAWLVGLIYAKYNKEIIDNSILTTLLYENGTTKYSTIPDFIKNAKKEIALAFIKGFLAGNDCLKKDEDEYELYVDDETLIKEISALLWKFNIKHTIKAKNNSKVLKFPKHTFISSYYNKALTVGYDYEIVKIESIKVEELDYEQVFYDIEVEDNHTFVLANGIIGSNCRMTFNIDDVLKYTGSNPFHSNSGIGGIGVYNINMNRILFIVKDNFEYFKKIFDYIYDVGVKVLQRKRQFIREHWEDLYPYLSFYQKSDKSLFNIFSVVGVHEGLINAGFKDGLKSEEGKEYALKLATYIREKIEKSIEEYGELFNLEYAPSENAACKLAEKDIEFAKKVYDYLNGKVVKFSNDQFLDKITRFIVDKYGTLIFDKVAI